MSIGPNAGVHLTNPMLHDVLNEFLWGRNSDGPAVVVNREIDLLGEIEHGSE